MTPTDKAAIEGLIAFIESDTRVNGDVALTECRKALPALQRLLAGETREAVVQANVACNACKRSLVGVTTYNAGTDTQCKPHGYACGLYGFKQPSPHDDAGADKPAGVPDTSDSLTLMMDRNAWRSALIGLCDKETYSPLEAAAYVRTRINKRQDPHHG